MRSAQYWRSKYVAERVAHRLTRDQLKAWKSESLGRYRTLTWLRKRVRNFAAKI